MSAVPNGVYTIQSVSIPANNMRRLWVSGETNNRAVAVENTADTWHVTTDPTGAFCTITHLPAAVDIIPHLVDLSGQNTNPGTPIIVYNTNNTIAQKWNIVRAASIHNRQSFHIAYHSQPARVISANGTGGSVPCQIAVLDNASHQQEWFFNPA